MLCSTVDRFVTRRTYTAALRISEDKALAESLAGDVVMTTEEKELIASLSETVCAQYSLAGQHTPAILLGIAVTGYGTRTAFVLGKLGDLAKAKAAQKEPDKKPDLEEMAG